MISLALLLFFIVFICLMFHAYNVPESLLRASQILFKIKNYLNFKKSHGTQVISTIIEAETDNLRSKMIFLRTHNQQELTISLKSQPQESVFLIAVLSYAQLCWIPLLHTVPQDCKSHLFESVVILNWHINPFSFTFSITVSEKVWLACYFITYILLSVFIIDFYCNQLEFNWLIFILFQTTRQSQIFSISWCFLSVTSCLSLAWGSHC